MSRRSMSVSGRRALVLALLAGLLALPAASPAAKKPAWPANVRLIEARLGAEAFATSFSLELPQFRFYNAEGWRLAHTTGYSSGKFSRLLDSLLSGRGTPDGHLLADDLAGFETPAGQRLTEVPVADFTVVEYWADWCQPCHKQIADLVRPSRRRSRSFQVGPPELLVPCSRRSSSGEVSPSAPTAVGRKRPFRPSSITA